MTKATHRRAKGHARGDMRQFALCFDEDTVAQINRLAEASKLSFAEQVRTLIEWGLEAADEA